MDIRKIKKLIELLEESGIAEIEIKEGEEAVRISRMPAGGVAAQPLPQAQPSAAPAAVAAAAPVAEAGAPKPKPNEHVITAPMVGTFYRAASPDDAPFVEEGSSIRKGQPLCIIEAMKTMNPVPSPVAGRITEIFVRDGQPVEFGEPLMRIE